MSEPPVFQPQPTKGKSSHKAIKWLAAFFGIYFLLLILIIAPLGAVLDVVLGNSLIKFSLSAYCDGNSLISTLTFHAVGESEVCKVHDAIEKALGAKNLKMLNSQEGDKIKAALDCSNVSPQARAAGECIPGLLATTEQQNGPVPSYATWMVPIWQAAAKQYSVPWQLLAAIEGSRSDFGLYNCWPSQNNIGGGLYRMSPGYWAKYAVHAGQATDSNGSSCWQTGSPYRVYPPGAKAPVKTKGAHVVPVTLGAVPSSNVANWFDAVDATFTEARELHALGVNVPNAGIDPVAGGGGSNGPLGPDASAVYQFFIGKGLSPTQAAGIVGSFQQESTNNHLDAGGYLAQWGGSRLTGLADYAAAHGGQVTDLAMQLGFVWQELNGSYKNILTELKATTSASQAAVIFSGSTNAGYPPGYESPGTPDMQNRIDYANEALSQFGGGASVGSTGGSTGVSTGGSEGTTVGVNEWSYTGNSSSGCGVTANDGQVTYLPDYSQGDVGPVGTVSSSLLTKGQETFASVMAAHTGLDAKVVAAWELAEESGGAAVGRQAANNNDWLNIGYTDSATIGASDSIWADPSNAAIATAKWIHGDSSIPGYGIAASTIQSILQTAGQSADAQFTAIASSGWASSGYGGGSSLRSTYAELTSSGWTQTAAPTSGNVSSSGKVSAKPVSYAGAPQTDVVSRAVKMYGPGSDMSSCYVAVVHDWYNAIVAHPPGSAGTSAGGGFTVDAQGYVNPFQGDTYTTGRTDQGVDLCFSAGEPIRAVGAGKVLGITQNWYAGQPYLWYQLLDGPDAGHTVYIAEEVDLKVAVGATLTAGEVIATYASSGSCIETGWGAANGSWQTLASSTTGYFEGERTPAGVAFMHFLGALGVHGPFDALPAD